MKPLTHCEQTLQVHRSVQNEFPCDSPADNATIVVFHLYAAACLSPPCCPLMEGTWSHRIPAVVFCLLSKVAHRHVSIHRMCLPVSCVLTNRLGVGDLLLGPLIPSSDTFRFQSLDLLEVYLCGLYRSQNKQRLFPIQK
jgi:hypothetical protein